MEEMFDDDELIKGTIDDIFNSIDKDLLRQRAEGIVVFHNTLLEGGLDEQLISECVMHQFFSIFF